MDCLDGARSSKFKFKILHLRNNAKKTGCEIGSNYIDSYGFEMLYGQDWWCTFVSVPKYYILNNYNSCTVQSRFSDIKFSDNQ